MRFLVSYIASGYFICFCIIAMSPVIFKAFDKMFHVKAAGSVFVSRETWNDRIIRDVSRETSADKQINILK